MVGQRQGRLCGRRCFDAAVNGQLANTPSRGLVNSWTGQLADDAGNEKRHYVLLIVFPHRPHHQLHSHKAEEQNCTQQTFNYFQSSYRNVLAVASVSPETRRKSIVGKICGKGRF